MVNTVQPAADEVWTWLAALPDPEIPVISLVDLGIIRDVFWEGDTLVVAVTPTYSGCPATTVINIDIERALHERGVEKVRLERRLSPPWSTAWISEDGRKKLREYGIAPPVEGTAPDGRVLARVSGMIEKPHSVACPRCGASRTRKVSQFGSTPCKAAYSCTECLEPFDYFKCI
jgi:ring-1,2-phenylacetyl-CoA epoxidase subunit PaaD